MLKIKCVEEIKKQLTVQKKRYPLMTEEDVVKFVFQGMLGPEHMVSSLNAAQARLQDEMKSLVPDDSEPLTEKISSDWIRLNLRPAMAREMRAQDIARYFACSTRIDMPKFTRQNVYNFCVKLDGSERMKAAAGKVLDENWLPRHSEQYRNAYYPAYRVIHKDFKKFKIKEDDE